MSVSQNPEPIAIGRDLEEALTKVKAEVAACKALKTRLYGAWKDAQKTEKPLKRSLYDDAANRLKILYDQQKVLQEEIKITSGKGKKRIGVNSSRRSPRKRARLTTENSDSRASSNAGMVNLDVYDPTPLESIFTPPLPTGTPAEPLQEHATPFAATAHPGVSTAAPNPSSEVPTISTAPPNPTLQAPMSTAAPNPSLQVPTTSPKKDIAAPAPLPPAHPGVTTAAPNPSSEVPTASTVPLNPTLQAPGTLPNPSFQVPTTSPENDVATPFANPLPSAQAAPLPLRNQLVGHSETLTRVVTLPIKKMQTISQGGTRLKKNLLKIPKGVILWNNLTNKQKAKLEFWARREASFMPELATHSKELAVMTLTTHVGNRMCHYHTHYTNHTLTDAKAAEQDSHPKITGIPYARTAVKLRVKKENNGDELPEDNDEDGNSSDALNGSYKPRISAPTVYNNAMNCGCSLEDVLLDFFFWKDTTAQFLTTGIKEGWCGEMMDPRTRTFFCAALRGQPAIELDWLYEIDGKGKMISLSKMYHKQGQNLRRWYKKQEEECTTLTKSDSEEESLLPLETNGQSSGDEGKQKMKTGFKIPK